MHDLPLLFGGFAKFALVVIAQSSLENLQNLIRRFARGADDEDAMESFFIFTIRSRENELCVISGCGDAALFFFRPPC